MLLQASCCFFLKMYTKILVFAVAAFWKGVSTSTQLDGNAYVIGGQDAPEGAYPYHVLVHSSTGPFCGGSIIAPTVILTAAHCVIEKKPEWLTVTTGSNQLKSGGTEYQVKEFVTHEKYNGNQHDIALVKLSSPIKYTARVAPIELETKEIGADVAVTLIGWGSTHNHTLPVNLQHLQVVTISTDKCKRHLRVEDTQICTLTRKGEGACMGDSGGALTANGKQVGIVSWVVPCAVGRPDVFTRVSSYIDWIKEHSK